MVATMRGAGKPVTVAAGLRFRAHYADGNPLWEVVRKDGRQTWICRVVAEMIKVVVGGKEQEFESDWAGTVKAFTTAEIQASVGMATFWQHVSDENAVWWATQRLGSVVHYQNSRDQFVRGVIVAVEPDGELKMCPTALVGNWQAWELPRRRPDGTVEEGHYARAIRTRETMAPNYGNMVESPAYRPRAGELDPRTAPAIDLTLPEPTPDEAARHAAERLCAEVAALLQDSALPPEKRLQTASVRLIARNLQKRRTA